jgi:hypothetical protein
MKERLSLLLAPSTDPGLTCLVCGRLKVDREFWYGTNNGHAVQGIHLRCVGRAEAFRGKGKWKKHQRST